LLLAAISQKASNRDDVSPLRQNDLIREFTYCLLTVFLTDSRGITSLQEAAHLVHHPLRPEHSGYSGAAIQSHVRCLLASTYRETIYDSPPLVFVSRQQILAVVNLGPRAAAIRCCCPRTGKANV